MHYLKLPVAEGRTIMGIICMDLYLKIERSRYRSRSRAVKKRILGEYCETHAYHPKAAGRPLR